MGDTVAGCIARSLAAHGVDRIFCVPGESYIGLTDALFDVPEIGLVVCRHEGGAGFMAVADGLITGRPGVCMVSRGPGLSNAMVAIHSAFHDAAPMVVLVGQVERKDVGRMALQEQNYGRLLADVTKAVVEIWEPSQASEAIARAFLLARSGTPGPVAVVLPEDLLDAPSDAVVLPPRPVILPLPGEADMVRLEALVANAHRPLVWLGGGIAGEENLAAVRSWAQAWRLPICATNKRPHLFDANHPNFAGHVGIRTPASLLDQWKRSDLLIALGERLTDTLTQSYTFPAAPEPQLPLVHVWPDADEIGRVWRPALGIAADPAALVRALAERPAPAADAGRDDWIAGLHAAQRALSEPNWELVPDGLNFAAVVCGINRMLPPGAIVTVDAGSFATFVFRYLRLGGGQQLLTSVVGAMGAGVPMAVAAGLRAPGRRVVAFVGDGGALMSGNELATARQYGVNPLIVIADNGCYGTIGLHHDVRYPGRPLESATQLSNPDFARWAESFGAHGLTLDDEAQVTAVLEEAFAIQDRPVVVHAKVSAHQMSAWRQSSRPLHFERRKA